MSVSNISKYFIQGVVDSWRYNTAPLNAFSKVTLLQGCNQNQYVTIPNVKLAATSSSDFTHASGYSGDNGDINGVNVQMSSWKYQPFDWTDTSNTLLDPEAQRRQGAALANKLAYDIVKDILSTTSSFSNLNQASGSNWATVSPVATIGATVDAAYWPSMDRSLIVAPDLYWKIASNTTTLIASGIGSGDVVKTGFLSDYYGFKVYKTHALPTTVKGMAATSRCLAVAFSTPTPQAGHNLEEVTQILDETENPLPLQLVRYYDNAKRKMVWIIETIYGKVALDAAGGYNLTITNINV